MKCNQSRLGFELVSPCSFPMAITTTPRAPPQVSVVDKLPMKGISLILGNEVESKKCHPKKMAKISAKNEETKMARMNAKNGSKMAKVNTKNGEDKMAAEPRARHKLHSCSQRGKVERKGVKLPHLRKQRDRRTGLQRKDESPKNNGNKFPNTYREDKRKIKDPYKWLRENLKRATKSCYYPQIKDHTVVDNI